MDYKKHPITGLWEIRANFRKIFRVACNYY
jgi:hypothetical protein